MRIAALAVWGMLNLACHLGDPPQFICRSDSTQFELVPMKLGKEKEEVGDASFSIGFDRRHRVLHVVPPTVTLSAADKVFGILSFTAHEKDQGFRLAKVEPAAPAEDHEPNVQIKSMALSDDHVVLGGKLIDDSHSAVLLLGSVPMSPETVFSVVAVQNSGSCSSVWARSRAVAAVCGGQLYVWSDWGAVQPNTKPRLLMNLTNPTDGMPIPVSLVSVTSDGTQIAVGGDHGVVCYGQMDSEASLRCELVAATDVDFQGGWINGSGTIHMVGTRGTIVRREAGESARWSTYNVPADKGSWSYKKIGALGSCQPLIVGQDSPQDPLQARGILLRQTTSGTWEQEQLPATDLTDFAGDDRDVFLLGVKDRTPQLWHRPAPLPVSGRTGAQRTL